VEAPLRRALLLLFVLFLPALSGRAEPATDRIDLQSLDRDDAAAEAALESGNLDAALKYFDYFGHEQEDFCRATLEYRLARRNLEDAVRASLGDRAWGRTARALGVPRHWRGSGDGERSARRDGDVVYVKNPGAGNEVPYVCVDGRWKVSARNVLVTALRARFGPAVDFEEPDLYVLAGKPAKVPRTRAARVSALAEDVRAKRVATAEQLAAAVDEIRSAHAAP
jgi:hypothetical protein